MAHVRAEKLRSLAKYSRSFGYIVGAVHEEILGTALKTGRSFKIVYGFLYRAGHGIGQRTVLRNEEWSLRIFMKC